MLPRRFFRIPTVPRFLATPTLNHSTRFYTTHDGKDGWSKYPNKQAASQGQKAHSEPSNASQYDAATSHVSGNQQTSRNDDLSGNPEGIGFADQVGSQTATAEKGFDKKQYKDGTSATSVYEGFIGEEDMVNEKVWWGNRSDKQDRGNGVGVTGTGTASEPSWGPSSAQEGKRTMWTSAVDPVQSFKLVGQTLAEESRKPKDELYGDQSEHLKHRPASSESGSYGKGNAAENPMLPSHKFNGKPTQCSPGYVQKREISTSRLANAEKPPAKHTADTYFKDVDSTPPTTAKTHQVDSSEAGAQVLQGTAPVTGDFSERGSEDPEYQTVSKTPRYHQRGTLGCETEAEQTAQMSKKGQPYDTPPSVGPEKDEKLRYGGRPSVHSERGPSGGGTSQPGEGPEGKSKGGRKPEGRS